MRFAIVAQFGSIQLSPCTTYMHILISIVNDSHIVTLLLESLPFNDCFEFSNNWEEKEAIEF